MRSPEQEALIDYTNWRGERAIRRIMPLAMEWKDTEWHPARQWLLRAVDVEKGEVRQFAMKDIHSWEPAPSDAKCRPEPEVNINRD